MRRSSELCSNRTGDSHIRKIIQRIQNHSADQYVMFTDYSGAVCITTLCSHICGELHVNLQQNNTVCQLRTRGVCVLCVEGWPGGFVNLYE